MRWLDDLLITSPSAKGESFEMCWFSFAKKLSEPLALGECDCIGSGISKRRANVCTYTHGRHALWLPNDAFNSTWPHILDLLTQLKYVRLDTLITFPIYYKLFQNNTWSSEESDISYCTMAVGLIIAGLWLNSKQDWPVRCCRCHSHIHAKLKAFHTWLTAQWPRLLT